MADNKKKKLTEQLRQSEGLLETKYPKYIPKSYFTKEQEEQPPLSKPTPSIKKQLRKPEPESITPTPVKIPGKEEAKERQKDKQIIPPSPPKIKKPEDFDTMITKIEALTSDLSAEDKKAFNKRKQEIQIARDNAIKQYKEDKDINKWLGIAETLGHALLQLGAGAYGMKHGVDMSGLKFNKTNWEKQIDMAREDLDRKLRIAKEEERGVEKEQEQLTQKLKEDTEFRKRAILQNYMAQQQAYKQQVLQAQRVAEQIRKASEKKTPEEKAKDKHAEAEYKNMIRKQEAKIKLLDKALAEADAIKEGVKGASLDKVAKVLGGETGAQFRKDIETPVSIFGMELWKSADEEEAPKVVRGYLQQAKAALAEMKKRGPEAKPEEKQEEKNERTIVKKQYSKSRDKTKILYSDGSVEMEDGKH